MPFVCLTIAAADGNLVPPRTVSSAITSARHWSSLMYSLSDHFSRLILAYLNVYIYLDKDVLAADQRPEKKRTGRRFFRPPAGRVSTNSSRTISDKRLVLSARFDH